MNNNKYSTPWVVKDYSDIVDSSGWHVAKVYPRKLNEGEDFTSEGILAHTDIIAAATEMLE